MVVKKKVVVPEQVRLAKLRGWMSRRHLLYRVHAYKRKSPEHSYRYGKAMYHYFAWGKSFCGLDMQDTQQVLDKHLRRCPDLICQRCLRALLKTVRAIPALPL